MQAGQKNGLFRFNVSTGLFSLVEQDSSTSMRFIQSPLSPSCITMPKCGIARLSARVHGDVVHGRSGGEELRVEAVADGKALKVQVGLAVSADPRSRSAGMQLPPTPAVNSVQVQFEPSSEGSALAHFSIEVGKGTPRGLLRVNVWCGVILASTESMLLLPHNCAAVVEELETRLAQDNADSLMGDLALFMGTCDRWVALAACGLWVRVRAGDSAARGYSPESFEPPAPPSNARSPQADSPRVRAPPSRCSIWTRPTTCLSL